MVKLRIVFVRNFVLLILTAMIGVLGLMLYDLHRTKQQLAVAFISKPLQTISAEMKGFFSPIQDVLHIAMQHGAVGEFNLTDTAAINRYFAPFLYRLPQISSMGIADKYGHEYDLIRKDDEWITRTIRYQSNDSTAQWTRLSVPLFHIDSTWATYNRTDPRSRPWYKGALENPGHHFWSPSYTFNTNQQKGITVSCTYPDRTAPDSLAILALDLTLTDLFLFTSNVHVSENGFGLILTRDLEFIEHPLGDANEEYSARAIEILHDRKGAEEQWNAFKFEKNNTIWWAQFHKLILDEDDYFIVGVVLPEKDMMAEVVRSQNVIYLGLGTTVLFMVMLFWTHQQIARANRQLAVSNRRIKEQSVVVQQKNKDILDSIHAAKRLQDTVLPPAEKIQALLPRSCIMYQPKDVVSGDFYWLEKQDRTIYFTVADCTGHGVPGAFMSILGVDLLKIALSNNKHIGPAQLLAIVRNELVQRLVSNYEKPKDGIDMALCSFDKDTHVLKFAGAMSNLILVKSKGEKTQLQVTLPEGETHIDCRVETDTHQLFIVKGDRIPIGYTYPGQATRFSESNIKVLPGDTIYLTTDGFVDQFGGEKGKKFGQRNFRQLLFDLQSVDIQLQGEEMTRVFDSWKEKEEQVDDVCVMGVRLMD